MGWLTLASWINDTRAAAREFYLFMRIDPASGMIVLGGALLVGRKVARHFIKGNGYRLQDIWKYPGEWLELAVIALLFLVGLTLKAVC